MHKPSAIDAACSVRACHTPHTIGKGFSPSTDVPDITPAIKNDGVRGESDGAAMVPKVTCWAAVKTFETAQLLFPGANARADYRTHGTLHGSGL